MNVDMHLAELLARFKGFQKMVAILLAVLVVGNVVTLAWILSRLDDLEVRMPPSVSCSGFSGAVPPADGVLDGYMTVREDLTPDGKAAAVASFRLVNKVPNSEVVFAYKLGGATEWSTIPMVLGEEALTYLASVNLDLDDRVEYRLEQRLNDEVVHASSIRYADMQELIGGNGDLWVYYSVTQDSREGRLVLHNHRGSSRIKAFQVAEVRLKINKARAEEAVLKGDSGGDFHHVFDPNGLKDVEITVVYGDGLVRTATFNPFAYYGDKPLIVR